MKVDILGTEYTIVEKEDERFEKHDADGFCEWWTKEIHIKKGIGEETENTMFGMKQYKENVIRHEIIHAFMFESGMQSYERDEQIVEWITRNIEKINKALEQAKEVRNDTN